MNLDSRQISIGELATRSGVPVATIRAWERRHGFPAPERLPSGHRRYSDGDVDALIDVRRRQAEGVQLAVALAQAAERNRIPRSSIMRTVRHLMDDVVPIELSRAALLILSRVIEDEVAARADRPLLVGAFQRDRYRKRSQTRWAELSRTSRATITFAVPDDPGAARSSWDTPLGESDQLAREWSVLCDSPSFTACLVGTERPPPGDGDRRRRMFEVLWTVEPRIVREATRTAVQLATGIRREHQGRMADELDGLPVPSLDSLAHATVITNRLLQRLDGVVRQAQASGAVAG
jgi:DNA-binding transcriptional MerR regulator